MAPRRRAPALYVTVTSSRPFANVKRSLGALGRVFDCGEGTVEDPSSMWFELAQLGAFPALNDLRAALTSDDCIRSLEQVVEGGGKDMARQIPLLSGRSEGLWRTGVPGGVVEPEPAKPKEQAPSAEQMPLFG